MPARSSLLRSIVAVPRLVGLAFILAIGLAVVSGATLVVAQRGEPGDPPPGPDVYYGCVNNQTSVLRVISERQTCQAHETAIELGSSSADAALVERIETLEDGHAGQQSLIETQQGEIDDLQQSSADQQTLIEALQQANADQQGEIDGLQTEITTLQGTVGMLSQQDTDQQGEIEALQTDLTALADANAGLQARLPACLSSEGDEVYFTGCNVNIRSGSGATDGEINGLGNLIIGYNEDDRDTRTGSHNLVIGSYHSYDNSGGIVAGYNNVISGNNASVLGGSNNMATGPGATVSGGFNNSAAGNQSSVSGGWFNTASGLAASVSGGNDNIASGLAASVSGGEFNTASREYSSVGGGRLLVADEYSEFMPFIPEQSDFEALQTDLTDLEAQVPDCLSSEGSEVYFTGCNINVRSGSGATNGAVNGLGNLVIGYNETDGADSRSGSHNLVIGEDHDYSSYGGLVAGNNNTISAASSSVLGGSNNVASGTGAAVSGGLNNSATDSYASVSGGWKNTASSLASNVSGGQDNTASGLAASVSGGLGNTASGDYSTVGGSLGLTAGDIFEFQPFTASQSEFEALQTDLTSLEAQVPDCLSTSGDEVYFTGCNVNIRSGSGATDGEINGLGNLVIGYNEDDGDTRTGSHNLVVGADHTYSSFGGLVVGFGNTVSGPYSSVSGGSGNTAKAGSSSISGGFGGIASGSWSSISGGQGNTAEGDWSSVGGGSIQFADADHEFLP